MFLHMRVTTERHCPEAVRSIEELIIHLMHLYAYSLVRAYARPTDKVLEVGFGEGYGSTIVRDWVREYHGVEIAPEAVAHASERYANPQVAFHHYSGAVLPFKDNEFDLVISFQVIEHVEDTCGYLREIRRVSRKGATILIVTPNRNHRLAEGEKPWNRYHVREYSPDELKGVLLQELGDVELFGIHGSPLIDGLEKARVRRARRLARLDPLGLRYRLPEGFDTRLRALLRRRGKPTIAVEAPSLSLSDIHHSESDVDTALDLLAIARA
jgi:SAM-dependent methyltransferase